MSRSVTVNGKYFNAAVWSQMNIQWYERRAAVSCGRSAVVRSWASLATLLGLSGREYVRMHFSLARIGAMLEIVGAK